MEAVVGNFVFLAPPLSRAHCVFPYFLPPPPYFLPPPLRPPPPLTSSPPPAVQIHRQFRKPLVVFSPKNLLRHPKCKSGLYEFDDEADDAGIVGVRFKRLIMDDTGIVPKVGFRVWVRAGESGIGFRVDSSAS